MSLKGMRWHSCQRGAEGPQEGGKRSFAAAHHQGGWVGRKSGCSAKMEQVP